MTQDHLDVSIKEQPNLANLIIAKSKKKSQNSFNKILELIGAEEETTNQNTPQYRIKEAISLDKVILGLSIYYSISNKVLESFQQFALFSFTLKHRAPGIHETIALLTGPHLINRQRVCMEYHNVIEEQDATRIFPLPITISIKIQHIKLHITEIPQDQPYQSYKILDTYKNTKWRQILIFKDIAKVRKATQKLSNIFMRH